MAQRNELVIRANALGLDPSLYPNDSKLEQKILYMQKNGTTYTETLGTGTLTSDATDYSAGDTLTIGNRTYTFRTALTGVKATGLLTTSGVFSDGETVTIQGVMYTMRTTLSSPVQKNEVLIGAAATNSLDNLKLAINKGATEGTQYSFGTTAHPYVTATTKTASTLVVESRVFGTLGNEYSISETGANCAWGAAKMGTVATSEVAGVANKPDEIKIQVSAAATLDVIKDAINNGALVGVEGTDYSYGTYAHTQVTATTNSNTQQVVQARNAAFDNASIATTTSSTGSHYSWGTGNLASGVRGVKAVVAGTSAGGDGVSGGANLI